MASVEGKAADEKRFVRWDTAVTADMRRGTEGSLPGPRRMPRSSLARLGTITDWSSQRGSALPSSRATFFGSGIAGAFKRAYVASQCTTPGVLADRCLLIWMCIPHGMQVLRHAN